MRVSGAGLVAAAVALGSPVGAGAALRAPAHPAAGAPLSAARLQGTFIMRGRLTVAVGVRGERRGQRVTRTWRFLATCPAGACGSSVLVRDRAGGRDRLTLRRVRGGTVFTGGGSFFVPLRCGSRTYAHGGRVPFSIRVRVTRASVVSGVWQATSLTASYRNDRRINLTPCVGALGHDAADYSGALQVQLPPSGGAAP